MAVKTNVVAPTLLILILFAVNITLPSTANSTTVIKPHSTPTGVAKGGHHPGRSRLNNRNRKKKSSTTKTATTTMPMPVDLLKKKKNHAIYLNHAGKEFLDAHNNLREYFGQQPYMWNLTLAKFARTWSSRLRESCAMEHSGGPYGENLFWGSGNRWRAVDAVQTWAMEHHYYDANNNSCLPGRMCGHYTQIVWRSSSMIGCARTKCRRGGVVMICNYDPPGNYVGENPFQTTTS